MENNEFTKEVGFIVTAKGYLLSISGLPSARINDILVDDEGNKAIVASLQEDSVSALLLNSSNVKSGNRFTLEKNNLRYYLGEHLFGRVVDVFGDPMDGKGSFPRKNSTLSFERVAPGVNKRKEITKQFETGISVVDVLYPIGKGQRQLLFGPTSSGKTTFIRDTIINQKGKDVICIYVGIGKSSSFMDRFSSDIFNKGADEYTILLTALAEDQTSVASIAPSVGLFIAEYFLKKGKEVLLILDDLGAHAKYMREITLLMGQVPGRQAYPGDIFYQHAHLLELAGNFNEDHGGGSITLLPVLETDIENFTDLIPTNLMAMTDGHLFFDAALRSEGYYPPIAIDRSVTRVGKQTQHKIQKELSTKIMMLFVDFKKQEEYSRFGTNLSSKTKDVLRQGEIILELLKQDPYENLHRGIQIALISLVFTDFLERHERPFVRKHKEALIHAIINDSRLADIRKLIADKSVSLEYFLKEYNKKTSILDSICHQ